MKVPGVYERSAKLVYANDRAAAWLVLDSDRTAKQQAREISLAVR
jgi:hypothetical protein